MKKQNVEQIIKELANQNFNLYPESYPRLDGLATNDATENAQDLAAGYFDNREELDKTRDEELEITKIDYVDWVCEEFGKWVQEQLDNAEFLKEVPPSM